jgi:fatty-acyl-CoA synthase
LESVGRPLDHLEIKIIDPKTGSIKAIGESGEVCIRGHCTFVGYWNQMEQTEEVLDKNRWYHTGY